MILRSAPQIETNNRLAGIPCFFSQFLDIFYGPHIQADRNLSPHHVQQLIFGKAKERGKYS